MIVSVDFDYTLLIMCYEHVKIKTCCNVMVKSCVFFIVKWLSFLVWMNVEVEFDYNLLVFVCNFC